MARASSGKKANGRFDRERYEALARFRYALRAFLSFSESAARDYGVTTQQYQALLAIKASQEEALLVRELADELLLKHNNTVQLVNRLADAGYVRRSPSKKDGRAVVLTLTAKGESKVDALATIHFRELLSRQKELSAISRLASKMEDIA